MDADTLALPVDEIGNRDAVEDSNSRAFDRLPCRA
jgi:hypothetical protein